MWIVDISHLSDEQLTFFGWVAVSKSAEFTLYRYWHDGTEQIVQNEKPRYMAIEDVNDAEQMSEKPIIQGPKLA